MKKINKPLKRNKMINNVIVKRKKVRKGIYATKDIHGVVNINGTAYFFYSMTEAIKKFRQENK